MPSDLQSQRAVRSVPVGDPERFLAAAEGQPRGFWGRGDRWVAWVGTVAGFEEAQGPAPAVDRFDQARASLPDVLPGDRESWKDVAPEDRPRLFGGFSFLSRTAAEQARTAESGAGAWSGFPVSRFVLPRLLLEGRDGRFRLVAQGTEGTTSHTDLQELLDRGEAMLAEANPDESNGAGDSGLVERASDPEAARARWDEAVGSLLEAMGRGEVEKVVLARIRDVQTPRPVDAIRALGFLRRENHRAHVYLFEPDPGRALLGAAPEILAELRGREFHATAVAGSVSRGATVEADAACARRLLASTKDRAEHRVTVDEMRTALDGHMVRLAVPGEPRVLTLARIQHLETPIHGLAREGDDVLSLVRALHPTPAVCGRPARTALSLIRSFEPFERGWYAGPVGWFDPAGDGDFAPALRSAVGGGGEWRLFAGAGIVEGSDAASEWDETALKFEPALRALLHGARVRSDEPGAAHRDAGAPPRTGASS